MHHLLIAITGTPGVGKTTFSKRLASKLEGSSLVEINNLVDKHELYSKTDEFGTKIVDLGALNRILSSELKKRRKAIILVGHLAPELRLRYDIAVVLRCSLEKLSKRLEKRHYPREKLSENIVSESLDYCGMKIAKKARETYEIESGEDKNDIISYIVAVANGEKGRKPRMNRINKLNDLLIMVKNGNRYGL
jgi:adenylate kinase